jgi:hypothetical protein
VIRFVFVILFQTGVPALIDQISAVGSGMSNAQIVVNGTSFSCSFCQTVGNEVTAMSNQLRTQVSFFFKRSLIEFSSVTWIFVSDFIVNQQHAVYRHQHQQHSGVDVHSDLFAAQLDSQHAAVRRGHGAAAIRSAEQLQIAGEHL